MKYIAHRGNDGNQAQNRMDEVLKTLNKENIDGVEIDIRITKDHKLILSHNQFLKEDLLDYKNSSTHKLKDLKKGNFILEGKSFPIHTLDEFLKKVKVNKIIIIECKLEIGDHKKYADAFLKIIHKYRHLNLYVCSFNYKLIYYIRQKEAWLPIGLLVGYAMNNDKEYAPFDYISTHYLSVSRKVKKRPYYVWIVNKKEQLNKWKQNKNWQGIITDEGTRLKIECKE